MPVIPIPDFAVPYAAPTAGCERVQLQTDAPRTTRSCLLLSIMAEATPANPKKGAYEGYSDMADTQDGRHSRLWSSFQVHRLPPLDRL
jgi:hypothetical protein